MMKHNTEYPRLLILGNTCLSQVNSNGRTLRNFLIGWPTDKIAQFFVKKHTPDFSVCENYFMLTDKEALNAFLCKGAKPTILTQAPSHRQTPARGEKRSKRTPFTMLMREAVWNSNRWKKYGFYQWVEDFSPEIILLQAGDSAFMLRLGRELSQKYHIPLVIYNSEAYYFKKHNYFRSKGISGWFYPVFRRYFRREFARTMQQTACSIYINEELKKAYDEAFSQPSVCIYTATEIQTMPHQQPNKPLRVSYLGNMSVGRHVQLVELANVLTQLCPETKLDVYGNIPTEEVKNAFDACSGIRYRGMIPYQEVLQVMHQSDILVHVENFSDFFRIDSKYAFSTKIADTLACGTCFLLYAPEELYCTEYLAKNQAAYVATSKEQLEHILAELCSSEAARCRYLQQAAALARKNHSSSKNAQAFQQILLDAWNNARI